MARDMGECRIWEGVWQEKKIWEDTGEGGLFYVGRPEQAVFTVWCIERLYCKRQN